MARVLNLHASGTNCDKETARAFEQAGAEVETLHLNNLLKTPEKLLDYDILCLPGGFSYGDDIGSGVVFALQLRTLLRNQIEKFLDQNGLIIGICNGFQVLLKAGLLSAESGYFEETPSATLTWNHSNRYEDRWVHLSSPGREQNPWLPKALHFQAPVRHAEGRFITKDEQTYRRLEEAGQLVLFYTDSKGEKCSHYPHNPNGSQGAVAGMCSKSGQVLGLMPHPECAIFPWHFPSWTRELQNQESNETSSSAKQSQEFPKARLIFQAGVETAKQKTIVS